ncbi:MAG: hypothetical protein KGM42_06035 [Hyphomicrobiales bacterium]|nr:hypothetical protein [Hyphomicrobiales bacterium]
MESSLFERARGEDAALLALVLAGVILRAYFGWAAAGYVAAPMLVAYIVLEWPRLRGNARALVLVSAIVAIWAALVTRSAWPILDGLVRACFYPAFLAALGFLRDAAGSSPMVARAGRYLVDQPPARRYVALTFGGHIFGILLNMGGLALLAGMLKQENTLESADGDARRLAIRERRMTLAVMRGFAAMPMWCPLSITMAMLFSLTPGAHWNEYAPYGLGLTAVYLTLGWLFDYLQYPRGVATKPERDPLGWTAALAMLVQIAAITLIALALERVTKIPFVTHVLVVVPAFALGWLILQNLRLGALGAAVEAARALAERSAIAFPSYANEVTLFATSGFLGAMIPALLPPDAVQAALAGLHLSTQLLSVVIVLAVAGLGMIGLNPMITLTLLLGALAHSPVEGLSPLKLVILSAGAWSLSNGLSPLNGSMVLLSNIVKVPSETITLRWNGAFAGATIALFCAAIYFASP